MEQQPDNNQQPSQASAPVEEKKPALRKAVTIIGLLAVLVIGGWVVVQAVSYAPTAFTSLASLVESTETNTAAPAEAEPVELQLTTSETVVSSGGNFTIAWTQMNTEGTYQVSYSCVNGVSLRVGADEEVLACDTPRTVDSDRLEMVAVSDETRVAEIPITITFTDADAAYSDTATTDISVVNAELTDEQEVDTTPTNTNSGTASGTPEPQYEIITEIPQSDPNGYTDLAVRHVGVGRLINGNFVPTTRIDNDTTGAIQFEVKNIGTKTSEEWEFETELPNGNSYSEDEQSPLKPNERVVFTLGFTFDDNDTGNATYEVSVDHPDEANRSNNLFRWQVEVIN